MFQNQIIAHGFKRQITRPQCLHLDASRPRRKGTTSAPVHLHLHLPHLHLHLPHLPLSQVSGDVDLFFYLLAMGSRGSPGNRSILTFVAVPSVLKAGVNSISVIPSHSAIPCGRTGVSGCGGHGSSTAQGMQAALPGHHTVPEVSRTRARRWRGPSGQGRKMGREDACCKFCPVGCSGGRAGARRIDERGENLLVPPISAPELATALQTMVPSAAFFSFLAAKDAEGRPPGRCDWDAREAVECSASLLALLCHFPTVPSTHAVHVCMQAEVAHRPTCNNDPGNQLSKVPPAGWRSFADDLARCHRRRLGSRRGRRGAHAEPERGSADIRPAPQRQWRARRKCIRSGGEESEGRCEGNFREGHFLSRFFSSSLVSSTSSSFFWHW